MPVQTAVAKYDIRDIALADEGKRRTEWSERSMPTHSVSTSATWRWTRCAQLTTLSSWCSTSGSCRRCRCDNANGAKRTAFKH